MLKIIAVCVWLLLAIGGNGQQKPQLPQSHGKTIVDTVDAVELPAPVNLPITPTLPTTEAPGVMETKAEVVPSEKAQEPAASCGPDIIIFCQDELPLNNADGWVDMPSTYTTTLEGEASWYQDGSVTYCGTPYDPDGLTIALSYQYMHRGICGASALVTYNGNQVLVTITDRMPNNGKGRIVDLSRGTKNALAIGDLGQVLVQF